MLAMGNSDVPVGQYTQKIFSYYRIDEAAVATHLTYGSNVKEVTTQSAKLPWTAASSTPPMRSPPV